MKDKIKQLTEHKIWLAPLAGYTDKSFRTICKEAGADVVVSEMVSADGLVYNKSKTIVYADFPENQRPFGIQLFGSDVEIMAKAIEIILARKPDFIDVNMGCPVKKVVKRGAGSALMKTPVAAMKIVKEMKTVLEGTSIPLSVKIRSGWDANSQNAPEFSQMLQDAGADIICIHPRPRSQMFSGKSDWRIIQKIKQTVQIPVIGNGDIQNAEDALKMFSQTGCDSVMIGRGAIGRPWIFREIKQLVSSQISFNLSNEKKLEIIAKHLKSEVKEKGKINGIKEMRKHLAGYTKGVRGGAKVRNAINKTFREEEIIELITELFLAEK